MMQKSRDFLKAKLSKKCANAKKRGIDFSLTIEDVESLWSRNDGRCDYTGLHFSEKADEMSATIERIDDQKGYVRGNLCLVCGLANMLKDSFLDKGKTQTIKMNYQSFHAVGALRYKVTKSYLNHLSNKYNPEKIYKREEDKYLNYFSEAASIEQMQQEAELLKDKEETKMIPTKPKQNVLVPQIKTSKVKEDVETTTSVHLIPEPSAVPVNEIVSSEEEFDLPEDVRIASYYSGLAKQLKKSKVPFEISYSDFKAKYRGKRCKFTQKTLCNDEKFMLMLDKDSAMTKDNVVLVDKEYGHKLSQAVDLMGLSVSEMAKMFKRLI